VWLFPVDFLLDANTAQEKGRNYSGKQEGALSDVTECVVVIV